MAIHYQLPIYYTPTTAASGIANIYGGVAHKPIPYNFEFVSPSRKGGTVASIFFNYPKDIIPIYTSQIKSQSEPVKYTLFYVYPPVESEVIKPPQTGTPMNYMGFIYFTPRHLVKQLYLTNNFVLSATSDGIEVYDITVPILTDKKSINEIVTSVWGNNEDVYMGTKHGVYYTTLHNDGTVDDPYYVELNLTSNSVNDIKGGTDRLLITTSSGVDFINQATNQHTYIYTTTAGNCWLSNNAGYFVTSDNGYSVNVVTAYSEPLQIYKQYTTNSGVLASGIIITDITVTNNTATNNKDTLICATSKGIYLIDTFTDEFRLINNNDIGTNSNMFTSVWSDYNTSLTNGIIYATTSTQYVIITLLSGTVTSDTVMTAENIVDNVALHKTNEY